MVSSRKNLESEFNGLCINPERKSRMRSKSFSHFPRYLVKRRCFVISSPRCVSKINRYPMRKSVIRPAKLKLPNVAGKSAIIWPAKLSLKNSKLFLLKPPTLVLQDDEKKKKKCRFPDPPFTSASSVPLSEGKVFNNKSHSNANFKSLFSTDDSKIMKAFDTSSFKQLRSSANQCSSTIVPVESLVETSSTIIPNKRESNSNNSCSVQARMESSAPTDCDDTSIDELACYFDLFVHIPKKMSSMAEMMYI